MDVLGASAIGFGAFQNAKAKSLHKDYIALKGENADYKGAKEKVEKAASKRNAGYIAGSALLAAGIGVHIFF